MAVTPGTALTDQFNFTTATIMVGPMASGLSMTPALNSLGLVKKVNLSGEPGVVKLTQGVRNEPVMSVTNAFNVKASAEIYEFTAKNLAYGLSLNGATFTPLSQMNPVSAAAAAAATLVKVAGDMTTFYTVGSWIFLQEGTGDQIHLAKVSAVSYGAPDTTVTFAAHPLPTGFTLSTSAGRIGQINKIDADPTLSDNYFAVRVVGTLVSSKKPIGVHFPKARITKGFGLNFNADNFDNLPFEFDPYVPLLTDPGYTADFSRLMNVFVP